MARIQRRAACVGGAARKDAPPLAMRPALAPGWACIDLDLDQRGAQRPPR
ncbi:hypothetical protein [Acidocella facilis]|nr:hypothetical protein [Acidocella facilis]